MTQPPGRSFAIPDPIRPGGIKFHFKTIRVLQPNRLGFAPMTERRISCPPFRDGRSVSLLSRLSYSGDLYPCPSMQIAAPNTDLSRNVLEKMHI
jgi:hypothetical protein